MLKIMTMQNECLTNQQRSLMQPDIKFYFREEEGYSETLILENMQHIYNRNKILNSSGSIRKASVGDLSTLGITAFKSWLVYNNGDRLAIFTIFGYDCKSN